VDTLTQRKHDGKIGIACREGESTWRSRWSSCAIIRWRPGSGGFCVIDVRDKTSKYDTSPNCRALSEIAKRYIAAGGLKQSAPCVADRIAEGAHAKAWMALAISKSGDPNLMIW
jgi:hypothetical protein